MSHAAAVELIPGETYLIVFDAEAASEADEVIVEELQSAALELRDKETLSASAELVAAVGAVGGTVFASLMNVAVEQHYDHARDWLRKLRHRGDGESTPLTTAEAADQRARQAAQTASQSQGADETVEGSSVQSSGPDWAIEVTMRNGLVVVVRLDADAPVAQVAVRGVLRANELPASLVHRAAI